MRAPQASSTPGAGEEPARLVWAEGALPTLPVVSCASCPCGPGPAASRRTVSGSPASGSHRPASPPSHVPRERQGSGGCEGSTLIPRWGSKRQQRCASCQKLREGDPARGREGQTEDRCVSAWTWGTGTSRAPAQPSTWRKGSTDAGTGTVAPRPPAACLAWVPGPAPPVGLLTCGHSRAASCPICSRSRAAP